MIHRYIKRAYNAVRAIVLTAVLVMAALYVLLYLGVSSPWVQTKVCRVAERELSALLGGTVRIGSVSVQPFHEIEVDDVELLDPKGETVAKLQSVSAEISLRSLLADREIVLTYAEITGLDARLWQQTPASPLNIDFIIKALQPKDPDKPKTHFELALESVAVRNSSFSFDKRWIPAAADTARIDFNHLRVDNLNADAVLPLISDAGVDVRLLNLSLDTPQGFKLVKLSTDAKIRTDLVAVRNLELRLPGSLVSLPELRLEIDGFGDLTRAVMQSQHHLQLGETWVTPSDLAAFVPMLAQLDATYDIALDAEGDSRQVTLNLLKVADRTDDFALSLRGRVANLDSIQALEAEAQDMSIKCAPSTVAKALRMARVGSNLPVDVAGLGMLTVKGDAAFSMVRQGVSGTLEVDMAGGRVEIDGQFRGLRDTRHSISGSVSVKNVDAGRLLKSLPVGHVTLTADADLEISGKEISGHLGAAVDELEWNGTDVGGITLYIDKSGDEIQGDVDIYNQWAELSLDGGCLLAGADSEWRINATLDYLDPEFVRMPKRFEGCVFSGRVFGYLTGNNVDNMHGRVLMSDLEARSPERSLTLRRAMLEAECGDDNKRDIRLTSDWVKANVNGRYTYAGLVSDLRSMLYDVLPALSHTPPPTDAGTTTADIEVSVTPSAAMFDFFNLQIRPLTEVTLVGCVNAPAGEASLCLKAPYVQQGRNKLIQQTEAELWLHSQSGSASLRATTTVPAKKGEVRVDAEVSVRDGFIMSDIGLNNGNADSSFSGEVSLTAELGRDPLTNSLTVDAVVLPSHLRLNNAEWHIAGSRVLYGDKRVEIEDFKVWHDAQFVAIEGTASASPDDMIEVRLADIDVDFIFDTLNINYVSFGGTATGEVVASGVFSGEPVAQTKYLSIRDLSYNGAVLGDGEMESHWDSAEKEVAINALITKNGQRRARVNGGIWVTRDSLSFDIDADKVNVAFLKPFMEAFASDISGQATGKVKLGGTFSDIDLTGRVKAEDVCIRLAFTNVDYYASDTITFDPGRIDLKELEIRDRYGHTAQFSGELTHRYFHDPKFEFRVAKADNLLVYDTNEQFNPDWYGTVFASGGALVRGWPGMVNITIDMSTCRNSNFTFALNDTQDAGDYGFLTFSDRRKERLLAERDTTPDFLKEFIKNAVKSDDRPTVVDFDLRMSVSPNALLNLVMDPVGGDKITARGNGSLNILYNSGSDAFSMFGKYTVDEGSYKFTLQDLIVRDFTIRPGSTIAFDGDPMDATLNIEASYRVNTNLSDLDKSFSTDRDLNRTNVPVDAVLDVTGKMQSPNIGFDIELPTLTAEVARKVRSIISTDDQMSRQILYLLALNRFYTPEYMSNGTGAGGGELAAVASSTLSSQLSSMLGQLTDKVSLAPSIRSEKGDFSDVEVDLALSSRLLDNRLLVNGNFGYRDRTTSSTTFVGDFDIEYLLSRNGGLRLKAYNHFNDQNYYLRSALTTQGLGVVYRHDFDKAFNFLRRKRSKEEKEETRDAAED